MDFYFKRQNNCFYGKYGLVQFINKTAFDTG